MRVDTLNKIELIGIVVFGLAGFIMIWYSSNLSTFIEPEFYNFYFDMVAYDGKVYRVNHFLLYYDFSKQFGNITFDINDNQNIEYFRIDFPVLLDESKTKIRLLKEKSYILYEELDTGRFEVDFVNNPMGQEKYTTLIVYNTNKTNISRTRVIVSFKAKNLEPNGVFTIGHERLPIGSDLYSINFNLGTKYYCSERCFNKNYANDAGEYIQSSDNDIKIRLNEEEKWHRFKIEANRAGNLFWISFLNGLGISLLASSIFLIFQYAISTIKEKNENLCPFCGYSYKTKRGLMKHIKLSH